MTNYYHFKKLDTYPMHKYYGKNKREKKLVSLTVSFENWFWKISANLTQNPGQNNVTTVKTRKYTWDNSTFPYRFIFLENTLIF